MDSTLIEIKAKVERLRISFHRGLLDVPTVLIEVNGDGLGKPCTGPRWKIRLELAEGVTLPDLFDAIDEFRMSDVKRQIGHTMMHAERMLP